jgi:hypothetical protein
MPGSMSGEEKRSDGLLGERSNERRRAHLAPPVLHTTALLLDSTRQAQCPGQAIFVVPVYLRIGVATTRHRSVVNIEQTASNRSAILAAFTAPLRNT